MAASRCEAVAVMGQCQLPEIQLLCFFIWINVWSGPLSFKADSVACGVSCSWSTQTLKP